MMPQQDFSKFFCCCCCPPLLSCSFLVPLGLLSHYPSTSLVVFLCFLFVSIRLRFLRPMPGGDHSSPGRVRKPVGPLGTPSPSDVLPTSASCVGQPFGVPGEPVYLGSVQCCPSARAFSTDDIASPGYTLLGCSASPAMRCR